MENKKLTDAAPLILDMFELTIGMLEITTTLLGDFPKKESTTKFIADARKLIQKVRAHDEGLVAGWADERYLETGKRPGEE